MIEAPWLFDDLRGLLMTLARRIHRDGLELECTPYLTYVILEVDGKDAPRPQGRALDLLRVIVETLAQVDQVVPALIQECRALEPGAEDRFYGALIFLLEMKAQQRAPAWEQLRAIASGATELAAALRAAELDHLASAVATAAAQLEAAPPVVLDPAVLAQLESMGRLVVGELVIPVPDGAQRTPATTAPFPVHDGELSATFAVQETPAQLHELYRTWARRDGWLVERDDPDPALIQLSLARGTKRFHVFAHAWVDGNAMLQIMVRAEAARFEPVQLFVPGPAPAWPALARPRPRAYALNAPLRSLDAVLADRGCVFAASSASLWFIDPVDGKTERIFDRGDQAGWGGLARCGDDVLATDRRNGQLLRIDVQRGQAHVVARDLSEPSHLAVIGDVAYVACQPTHLRAIELGTGATLAELAVFPAIDKLQALCAHGDDLVAADYRYVLAIDRRTGAVTRIADLDATVTGIASDGANLYATVWGAIHRIERAGRRRELVGRGPISTPARDGGPGTASVKSPAMLCRDDSRLLFVDDGKLRWLALTTGHVATIRDAGKASRS